MTKKTEVVLGTRDRGRISEFRSLFKGSSVRILSLYDFSDIRPPVEQAKSLEHTAANNAKAIAKATRRIAISECLSLQVDFLGQEPIATDTCFPRQKAMHKQNSTRLLTLLDSVPWHQRTARVECVVCAADSRGKTIFGQGVCHGNIAFDMRGSHALGYDRVFVPDGHRMTVAEMPPGLKNTIDHRTDVLRTFRTLLRDFIIVNELLETKS